MSLFLLLLALCCPAFAARIQVQVEDDTLVLGQNAVLEVQIVDGRHDGVPEFPVESGLRARYRGQSTSRSIVNMKTTSIVRYSYQLSALKAGEWTVGPFDFEVDGKRLAHPAITIEVQETPAGEEEPVAVVADLSDDRPYVGELVSYRLEFRRRVEAHNIRWTPPETPGFIAEPSTELAQRDRSEIENGVEEAVLDIYLPLRATTAGEHSVSPAVITADLPAPPDPRTGRRPVDVFGRYRLRSKSLPTKPMSVEVRPLPEPGRPADFSGLVGSFALSVDATDTRVAREETVTLTVTLAGTGVLAGFTLPPVPDTDKYRVYDDSPTVETVVTADGVRSKAVFRRAVVPLTEGELVIPPIALSVFDPDQEAYVTVASSPLKLTVSPGVAGEEASVERFATGESDQRRDVEALGDDILPAPGGASISDRTFAGALPIVVGLPLLPILGGLLLAGRTLLSSRSTDPWAELAARSIPADPAERITTLSWMFRQAASLRLGCAPAEVDRKRLEGLGEAVVQLYSDLEAARFGGGATGGLIDRVRAFVANKGTL
jgi:hypothetical protein